MIVYNQRIEARMATFLRNFMVFVCIFLLKISICHENVVVFDLNGVLFDKTAVRPYINKLGLSTIGSYLLIDRKKIADLKKALFLTLHKIGPMTDTVDVSSVPQDDEGNELPHLMVEWLQGKIAGSTIIEAINNAVTHNPSWFSCPTERILINRLADAIFNPITFATTQRLHADAHHIVSTLKDKGYKVYILSNWDKDSFDIIRKKYEPFFDLFDGMIISGNVGFAKPELPIYECLLKEIGVTPNECIFIDDQPINIAQAKKIGIRGLLCPQYNGWFGKGPNLKLALRRIIKKAAVVKQVKNTPTPTIQQTT
jgi:HAD superfamily hydrolase (TIGR01549 family)